MFRFSFSVIFKSLLLTFSVTALAQTQICNPEQQKKLSNRIKTGLSSTPSGVDFYYELQAIDGRVLKHNRGSILENTVLESASTSKWVTATIILWYIESETNLASSNPLTLESRPQDFLGNLWTPPSNHPLANMTLRHLLSFTSGLIDEPACIHNGASNFEICVSSILAKNLQYNKVPGKEFYYSGTHMQVAGLMAIKARALATKDTKSNWQSLFGDFKIANKTFVNSTFDLPSSENPRLGGGMRWTAREYMDFLHAYKKGKILKNIKVFGYPKTLRQIQLQSQTKGATIVSSPVKSALGLDWQYGLGVWVECADLNGVTCDQTNQKLTYSSPGAYGAYPYYNVSFKYHSIFAIQEKLGSGASLSYPILKKIEPDVQMWASNECPISL